MGEFYGGKQGFSFHIAKSYETYDKMLNNKNEVKYGEYALISGTHNNDPYRGDLYRKDFQQYVKVGNVRGLSGGLCEIQFHNSESEFPEGTQKMNTEKNPISFKAVSGTESDTINMVYGYTGSLEEGDLIMHATLEFPFLDVENITTNTLEPEQKAEVEIKDTERTLVKDIVFNIPKGIPGSYFKPEINNDNGNKNVNFIPYNYEEGQWIEDRKNIIEGGFIQEYGILNSMSIKHVPFDPSAGINIDSIINYLDRTISDENKKYLIAYGSVNQMRPSPSAKSELGSINYNSTDLQTDISAKLLFGYNYDINRWEYLGKFSATASQMHVFSNELPDASLIAPYGIWFKTQEAPRA